MIIIIYDIIFRYSQGIIYSISPLFWVFHGQNPPFWRSSSEAAPVDESTSLRPRVLREARSGSYPAIPAGFPRISSRSQLDIISWKMENFWSRIQSRDNISSWHSSRKWEIRVFFLGVPGLNKKLQKIVILSLGSNMGPLWKSIRTIFGHKFEFPWNAKLGQILDGLLFRLPHYWIMFQEPRQIWGSVAPSVGKWLPQEGEMLDFTYISWTFSRQTYLGCWSNPAYSWGNNHNGRT